MSEEQNRKLVERVWQEIINDGNLDVADELIAEEFTYRGPGGLEFHGPQGFRQYIASLYELFENIDVTVDEYLVDGNSVLSRWTGHGTNKETGREVIWTGATITHVADGKMVDDWEYWDRLDLAEQLADNWLQRFFVSTVADRTTERLPTA